MNLNTLHENLAKNVKIFVISRKKILVVSFLPMESSQVSCLYIGGAKAMWNVETSFGILMQISKLNYVQKSHEIVSSYDI